MRKDQPAKVVHTVSVMCLAVRDHPARLYRLAAGDVDREPHPVRFSDLPDFQNKDFEIHVSSAGVYSAAKQCLLITNQR